MPDNSDNQQYHHHTKEDYFNTLQAVFDAFDPSCVIGRNGIIQLANKAFASLFGKQVQEYINTNAFDIFSPDIASFGRDKAEETFRSGKIVTFDDERDGRFVRFSLYPIVDNGGQITRLLMTGHEISEMKLAEKEASDKKFFSSSLIESIPGAFYMIDPEGRFVEWNTYERDIVVGKPEDEMANTFIIETVHPGDRLMVTEKIRDILEHGHEESVEVRILMHGGPDVRWFQATGKRIIINDVKFLIGTGIDINEHKLAEDNALRNSEDRFRTLFEEHSSVQLIIDHETAKIIDANRAAATYYGWSIEKLRTMSMHDINTSPPEEVKHEIEMNRLSGHRLLSYQHRKADGSIRDVEVLNKIITVNGKKLSYAIIHDVTERRQAENQLQKMSVAIEQNPTVVVMTDPAGNIEYVNPQFTEHTGYTAEEAKGQNPRILKSGLMPKSVYEDLWNTILAGKIWRGELQNKKKNGELFWERAIVSAIRNSDGIITNFVAVKEDITEQKKMMDALIAAKEKAEENDRLKSAFLANISHEIRTPMNGILGFSELLKEPQLSGEEQAEYIDLIHQSGQRMLNLINDLIDISRIEAGETYPQIAETPINEVCHDLCAFFKPQADKKGLRLTCTTGLPDHESIIVTDQIKLQQILTNLVQNSLKFTRTGSIDIGYARKGNMLTFYVSDSGIGVPLEMQHKIFERFRQADNSLTRAHEGSGLGLSISKAYVEMLGGTIRVVSEGDSKGSRFTFSIPYNPLISKKIDHKSPSVQEPTGTLPGLTILIAEDDEVNCYLLQKSLKGENITLFYAGNGLEAVALVKSHPEIDLVLMDIKMPVMNGYEATRQIKQLRPEIPVIAQTAFTSNEDKEKAAEAGCDRFITKPIKKNELLRMMHELLHK